jgi:hypothetical protein
MLKYDVDDEHIEETKDKTAEKGAFLWAAAVFIVVIGLWAATPFVVNALVGQSWEHRGQFGDIYGSVNALFSGLAFAGVIIAILWQRRELELQRRELRLTRKEMKASTAAQDETQRALNKTLYAQSFKVALDIIEIPEVINARRVVYKYRENLNQSPKDWAQAGIDAADLVIRRFDAVGRMVKRGMLPSDYILDGWSIPICQTWAALEKYIQHQRQERSNPSIGEELEALAIAAEKYLSERP